MHALVDLRWGRFSIGVSPPRAGNEARPGRFAPPVTGGWRWISSRAITGRRIRQSKRYARRFARLFTTSPTCCSRIAFPTFPGLPTAWFTSGISSALPKMISALNCSTDRSICFPGSSALPGHSTGRLMPPSYEFWLTASGPDGACEREFDGWVYRMTLETFALLNRPEAAYPFRARDSAGISAQLPVFPAANPRRGNTGGREYGKAYGMSPRRTGLRHLSGYRRLQRKGSSSTDMVILARP